MATRTITNLRGIVTGASGGIGRALTVELVRQGARIVVVARREEPLRQLAEELKTAPGAVEIVIGDITDPTIRQQAVEQAKSAFGGLDLLVNNAGVGALGRFDESTPERLRQVMELDFFAAAEMTRVALPLLKAGNRPIVVNIGSILGHRALPRSSEYCASKFALRGLSESLRAELAPLSIDVLMVSPATTDTAFFDNVLERDEVSWSRSPRMPADEVARRTVKAIRRGRHEIFPSRRGWLLVLANRLFPGILDRILARQG